MLVKIGKIYVIFTHRAAYEITYGQIGADEVKIQLMQADSAQEKSRGPQDKADSRSSRDLVSQK